MLYSLCYSMFRSKLKVVTNPPSGYMTTNRTTDRSDNIAKLYFNFGTVNSGKSLELLKVVHNYEEQDKNVMILTSNVDDRYGVGKVTSRVGLSREAIPIGKDDDLVKLYKENREMFWSPENSCIVVDEAQFLSKKNIHDLATIVDEHHTPVIAYGLKTDFSNKLFEGSKELLIQADKLVEIKTICGHRTCGRKATMNIRTDENGQAIYEGEQIEIGGNEKYVPVCRYHYFNY